LGEGREGADGPEWAGSCQLPRAGIYSRRRRRGNRTEWLVGILGFFVLGIAADSQGSTGGPIRSVFLRLSLSPVAISAHVGWGLGTTKTARALYNYTAGGEDELSLVEGETVELTERGMDYADGWAEIRRGSRVGIAPSSYLEEVAVA
jgi:hypothetical protein